MIVLSVVFENRKILKRHHPTGNDPFMILSIKPVNRPSRGKSKTWKSPSWITFNIPRKPVSNWPGITSVINVLFPSSCPPVDKIQKKGRLKSAMNHLPQEARPTFPEEYPEDHYIHGKIIKFFPHANYGFIRDTKGKEVYFHLDEVRLLNHFHRKNIKFFARKSP